MTIGVPDLMRETRNYFQTGAIDGCWTLKNGVLSPAEGLIPGDWIAITGTRASNGVYQLGTGGAITGAADESWSGRVWLLSPPADFIALAAQISAWCEKRQDSTVTRESFGAYSRTEAVGTTGRPFAWQETFAPALAPYRRMYTEVNLSC